MNFNKLLKLIATKEGKKHQASIGDIREIMKCLKVVCQDYEAHIALLQYLYNKKPKSVKLK